MIGSESSILWAKATGVLQRMLAPEVHARQIAPLRCLEFSQTSLVLEAPVDFPLDAFRKSFQGLVEMAAEQTVGATPRLTLQQSRPVLQPNPESRSGEIAPVLMNPRFTFDTFVVGGNSQFAHSAAKAVADAPGRTRFNPLMIYGGSGLGKTHLLQAIGNQIETRFPEIRVRYVPTDDFKNQYIYHVQKNLVNDFSSYYRNQVDVLLMDDIQFLVGRDALQQEFFHLFNAFHQSNRQIVLTSDCSPGDLQGLEERLVSRFQWGLSVDIQPPDRDTREAILRNKAQEENLDLSEEIISYIAENIDTNIRHLEGIVRRLILEASIQGGNVTLRLAQDVVEAQAPRGSTRRFSPQEIAQVVADYYRVEPLSLFAENRGTKDVSHARQVAMYLAKQLTQLPYKSIGGHFGDRDHSTVIHACDKVGKEMKDSPTLRADVEHLLKVLR
ncbi:MAG TPA: chromosomal replication initiator protein DnaA [Fibrobacteria bacterium]|nr:chromosomal replication initiator protein DnaA [Fibrobacteria bacterium]